MLLPIASRLGPQDPQSTPDEAVGDRVVVLGVSRQRRQQHHRRSLALDNGLDDDAAVANQHARPLGMQATPGISNAAMVSAAINRMGLTAPRPCQRSRSASARSAIISFFFILSRGGSSSGGMMPCVMLVG